MPKLALNPIASAFCFAMGTLVLTPTAQAAEGEAPSMELTNQSDSLSLQALDLKPGEYLWQPERAMDGPIDIAVSMADQRAYIYRGRTLIGVTTISGGKEGHETPLGRFTILQKEVKHRSNLYNSAPMPYMQRLTWDGVAFHSGSVPGYPTSHGCIHLPAKFAKTLFGATDVGATVEITDSSIIDPSVDPIIPEPPADGYPGEITPDMTVQPTVVAAIY